MRDASPMLYGQWLNRSTRVKPVLLTYKPLLTSSRLTLPGKPVGFSRSVIKRLPERELVLNRPSLRAVSFLPIPEGNGSPERTIMKTLSFGEKGEFDCYR